MATFAFLDPPKSPEDRLREQQRQPESALARRVTWIIVLTPIVVVSVCCVWFAIVMGIAKGQF
jgi:hypothetical protein